MSNGPENTLFGGCQCGAVTYTSRALPSALCHCHCLTCRKVSGSPFLTFAQFPADSIVWTSKPDHTLRKTQYSSVAERAHCADCGSPVYMRKFSEPNEISIPAGTIDESRVTGVVPKPDHHIFVDSKAGWYEMPQDNLPRYGKFRENDQRASGM